MLNGFLDPDQMLIPHKQPRSFNDGNLARTCIHARTHDDTRWNMVICVNLLFMILYFYNFPILLLLFSVLVRLFLRS